MALDLDPGPRAPGRGGRRFVVFGDAARLSGLMAAGLARASAVVVTYHDVPGGAEGAGTCVQRMRRRCR